jgi:hypothetical protein
MKRTLLLAAIACLSLLTANAQLANSKWKGVIKIPAQDGTLQPMGVTWSFQQDTTTITYDNGMQSDVMIFKDDKTTVSFRKLTGGVPCDTTALLTCSYQIKNDQLFLKMIQDACAARSHADASAPFDRMK